MGTYACLISASNHAARVNAAVTSVLGLQAFNRVRGSNRALLQADTSTATPTPSASFNTFTPYGSPAIVTAAAAPAEAPATIESATPEADPAASVVPDYTSGTSQQQWFLAGGDVGTTLRAEAIPGRVFYDFDGVTVKDPFDVLQDAGFNAVRVETFLTQCTGPTMSFDNSGDVLGRELNFQLDDGCIDIQVQTAQLGKARNMKIILTVNFGTAIPTAWVGYNYVQVGLH